MQYRNIDKQALKENGYTVLSKITIVGTNTVFTEDDHIVDWTYEDYRYVPDNGFIGQFVERIFDGNLQDISEDVILEDTEINLQLGIVNGLDNNTTTWYNYGNFLVTKVEKTDTTGEYKFESADYTKKFNKVFDGDYTDTTYTKSFNQKIEDEETVTALWLAQYVCKQAGVVLNDTNFTNYNFVISSNQYDSDDTLRKVMQDIGKLAYSWVRVGEDNKVHIDFTPKATSSVDQYDRLTTDEYYVSKKSDLTFGPVNKVLIGMSDVEGENLYVTSPDYTEETECAIKIYDNNLTNTEELRQIALNGASRLFGLTYTPVEINSVGHPWLDGDELIKLTNVDGVELYTYPFNRKLTYSGYIEGTIGAEAQTSQQSKYEYKSDIISDVKKTSIIVDKQEQTITALVNRVEGDESDLSQLQVDVNGIDARVTSVETTQITGVTNEYAVNDSATNPPAESSSSWSETKPTRGEGQYIWARIKTTYKNGNIEYSDPVNTTGDKGDKGEDAAQAVMYHNAKGTEIYTEDAGDLALKSVNLIEGEETTQETTIGKNLLKPQSLGETLNGITASYEAATQTYTFNGTCTTNNTTFQIGANDIEFVQNTTQASAYWVGGSVTNYCSIRHFDENYGTNCNYSLLELSESNPKAHKMTTLSFTCPQGRSTIRFDNGSVANNFKVRFMVANSGEFVHEPYTNGPSPNPDYPQPIKITTGRQEADIIGKNLLDLRNGIATGSNSGITATKQSDYTYTFVGTATSNTPNIWLLGSYATYNNYTDYLILDKTKILFSLQPGTYTIKDIGIFCIYEDNTKSNVIPTIGNKSTFTLTKTAHIVAVRTPVMVNGTTYDTIIYPQIENGSNSTDYEPYKSKYHEINLGKNLWNYNIVQSSSTMLTSAVFSVLPNTTYTYSTSANNIQIKNYYKDSNKNDISSTSWQNMNYTFTTPSNCYYIQFTAKRSDGSSILVSDLTNFQLEKSDKATSFSPYFEPIFLGKINDYKNIIRKGKGVNLFDKDNTQWYRNNNGAFSNTTDTSTNRIRTTSFEIQGGKTYTLSGIPSGITFLSVRTYTSPSASNVDVSPSGNSFTLNDNVKYIHLLFSGSDFTSATNTLMASANLMLNEGTSALPYEPYNAKGKWYLHKEIGKVVLNGSESWQNAGTNPQKWSLSMSGYRYSDENICISNYFRSVENGPVGIMTDNQIKFRYHTDKAEWLYICDNRLSAVADFKTWLGTHNVTLYYVLAIPIITEITNDNYPELLSQLNELEELHLFEGINNITINGDLPIILDMDYWTWYKGETGDTGEEGKGIESTTELYYVTNQTSTPSQPTSHVTLSSLVGYNAWNLQCPPYTTTYKNFYTCSEILYTDGTYGWTNVTQNQGLAIANQNAYNATQTANTANSTANLASSAAATATTTANNAWNKINNLQIGGRNLLENSSFNLGNKSSWETAISHVTIHDSGGYMNYSYFNYTHDLSSASSRTFLDNTSVHGKIKDGDEITISGYYRNHSATSTTVQVWIRFSVGGSEKYISKYIDFNTNGEWTYFEFTGTVPTVPVDNSYPRFQIAFAQGQSHNVDFCAIKVEKGNKPTDWTAAPEDMEETVSELNTYVDNNIQNLQNQIDGAIQFWNGPNIPTLSNYPASSWTTEAERTNHQADIYTVIQDVSGELKQGKSYRFDKVNGTWLWIELTDNELSAVQALASSKAKVYVSQPVPPYNVGDLWLYNDKLYKCKTAKDNSGSYSANDWDLATDYTNDATANQALNKINNLQIGGTNRILLENLNKWIKTGNVTPMTSIPTGYSGTLTYTNPGGGWEIIYLPITNLEVGKEYTFSVNVEVLTDYTYFAQAGNWYGPYLTTTIPVNNKATDVVAKIELPNTVTAKTKYTTTFTNTSETLYLALNGGHITDGTGVYSFYFENWKLEQGNIATDWSPAPEDTESRIADTIVGTQTASTRFWTGVASFNELKEGQEILYWNPLSNKQESPGTGKLTGCAGRVDSSHTFNSGVEINSTNVYGEGNISNVWLNLTLANGLETGWIPCYLGTGGSRVTNQYNGGRNIRFTYLVNAKVNGTGTTSQYTGWFAEAGFNSDTTDRLRYQSNIKVDQMYLNSGRLAVSADNGNYIELNRNCSFRIDKPILYTGSALSILGTGNNNYLMYSYMDLRNNLNNSNFDDAHETIGSSVKWYRGTGITGTSTTATVFSGSGVSSAVVDDRYTNSSTGNVYKCTTAGNASTAKWVYVGYSTAKAAGKKWYAGTTLSGTGTGKTGVVGTVGDYYWNTSSGTYYKCTTTGTASTAKWDYMGILTKVYQTLYLRGHLDGNIFTVDDVPFMTEIPTTPDDLYYISLGSMYSVYQFGLFPEHPIYKFVNGEFKSLDQVAYDAQVNLDNMEIGGRNLLLNTVSRTFSDLTLNSSNYQIMDFYKTVTPVPNLFAEDDIITISFDWSTTATSGNFHVECGKVTPYTWGTVINAINGRSKTSNYVDITSTNTSGHFIVTFKVTSSQVSAADTLEWLRIRVDGTGWSGQSFTMSNAKLERGNKATDYTPAPEDIQEEFDDITANFTNYVTTVTYDADWTNRKDEIYSYVSERYTTTSDFGEYQETMQTALSQKADAATISATATQVVNDALSGISETISNVEETFSFSTNGLEIARSGNTMSLLLQNDRMSFMSSGSEKMYMTSNSLVLYDLEQLQLGNYAFVVRANGSIDFKKVQ